MQRQSLGSPSPRLHGNRSSGASIEVSAASPSPSSPSVYPVSVSGAGEDVKLEKLGRRLRFSSEKYVHLIPILTLLCLLVLFQCSHEPSPIELADFYGINHPSKLAIADSVEIDEFERVLDKVGILATRSMRNLQQIRKEASKSSRSHRKLGHFVRA